MSVLTSEMLQTGDDVTLNDLKDDMDQSHRLILQTIGHADAKLGLRTTCYNCGEQGHVQKSCPRREDKNNRNFLEMASTKEN